ncbi:MAG: hypothetical protein KKD53_08945, partial [Proteobacteria bacterium]|nr:hypothetical protein [Pseudomonadota bacterium]
LTVQDQGAGFIPALKGPGFGLAGITERVELINGRLEIDTAPGKGTTITVVVPTRLGQIIPPITRPETEPDPAPSPA